MKSIGIIPARYAASRFPGKALIDIKGKSMIQRVYLQAKKAASLDEVLIATDDEKIFTHASSFGAKVMMTDKAHQNGTSRIGEVLDQLKDFEVILNIQGDEPFLEPAQLDALVAQLKEAKVEIATMAIQIQDPNILFDPNTVKLVFNKNMNALYFSRNPIPYVKGVEKEDWLKKSKFYKHIGLYGFRSQTFKKLIKLPVSPLAKAESLEQLTWLENGHSIKVILTDKDSIGIDTPEDLAWALEKLSID